MQSNYVLDQKKIFLLNILCALLLVVYGCVSQDLRLPSSAQEVYQNNDVQQGLMMAAQNNVLFAIAPESLTDLKKSEIDTKCRKFENPFWAEKLSVYLNRIRQNPEWFTKFHVLEFKKGDMPQVQIQKDMDGAAVLSINYVMTEARGKVSFKTQLPCEGNLAEFIGKDLVVTDFEFPKIDDVIKLLAQAPERKNVSRFSFDNGFLMFLAERGTIFKFSHEQSFEKNSKGQYVMVEALNKVAADVKKQNVGYLNLWIKKINQNSKQADLIQLFGFSNDQEIKAGVKVETQGEFARKTMGQPDVTYLFMTFKTQGDDVVVTPIADFEHCLQDKSKMLGNSFLGATTRNPASRAVTDFVTGEKSSEGDSFLSPGFTCLSQQ